MNSHEANIEPVNPRLNKRLRITFALLFVFLLGAGIPLPVKEPHCGCLNYPCWVLDVQGIHFSKLPLLDTVLAMAFLAFMIARQCRSKVRDPAERV